jgi:hypothetical protein
MTVGSSQLEFMPVYTHEHPRVERTKIELTRCLTTLHKRRGIEVVGNKPGIHQSKRTFSKALDEFIISLMISLVSGSKLTVISR